jgi:glycosyltransferase involved in cell wall biosynthesis
MRTGRDNKFRVAYFVSHPIQYQAPLLRRLALESDIDLKVFFWSDHSVTGYADQGFGGVEVKWDVPLLEGYKFEFLPVIRRSTEVSLTAPMNRGCFRALRTGKFDAVWLHGYWNVNSLVTMAAAKVLGIPVLLRAESTLIERKRSGYKLFLKKTVFWVLRKFVTAVMPIGSLNRQYWAHYFGPGIPTYTMPYAVDNEYFQSASREAEQTREAFREQLGLRVGQPIILYASKLMDRKRCIDLIDAYLGLRPMADGGLPYLLIVGDGVERANLEARVRGAGVNNVLFLGFQNQSQLSRFYDLCDIFVLPSVDEPFGLIVNEVMNAARPVVVSDEVGCQPDLVRDGENGRVFRARNVTALRDVLDSLLSDLAACRRMGQRALADINKWSFEEDVRGLRQALHFVTGLQHNSSAESILARHD